VVDLDQKAELNKTLACLEVRLCTSMFFKSLNPEINPTLNFNFNGPGDNN
jgi:hypothetical protein